MPSPAPAGGAPVAGSDWFAHRFDGERAAVHLIPATREQLRAAVFLTDVNMPGAARPVGIPLAAAVAAASGQAPVHFLLHSAFCCSTLLSRALDRDGIALALREPVTLNDVVGWRGRGAAAEAIGDAVDSVLQLLAQSAGTDEAVVIKPSNLANPLAPALLARRPAARAVLLHAPLPTFLASVASKQLEGRLWVRDLWAKLLRLGVDPFGFSPDELFRHTDIQVAALGWLAQHRLFAELAARFPDRVRTLSSETLLRDPAAALVAAARHYGLAWPDAGLHAVANGPLFTRHAKTGQAFGAEARDALHQSARRANDDEIGKVDHWAGLVADSAGVPRRLPASLLPD